MDVTIIALLNPEETLFARWLPNLIALYEAAYSGLPPRYSDHGPTKVRDYLQWLFVSDPAGFFVALENDTLVGFASLNAVWPAWRGELIGELHEVVVHPGKQGKGIGRQLIDRVLQRAKDRRRDRVRLWVGEKNERAATLYRKLGFVTLSRNGVWERMELVLTTCL